MAEQPQFWFNVRTARVETNYDKSQGKDLMGPYLTHDAAAQALAAAAERTQAWDEEDRRWRDQDSDDE